MPINLPSESTPFIIETAPSRKGPWTKHGNARCKAKELYQQARDIWGADRAERPWVRVRRFNSERAVTLFYGGTYKPVGENARFGWQKVQP